MRGVLGSTATLALMATGLVGGVLMRGGVPVSVAAEPGAFTRAMAAAMARMHTDMMQPPSGDPDRDFAAMMIPHHQGAIDMARLELAHGTDPVLRRLAQGIIVEQGQEIAVMRGALAAMPAAPPALRGGAHDHRHDAGTDPAAAPTEMHR